MSVGRILILVAIAFGVHALEEYATNFYTTDPTVLWLAFLLSAQPFLAWVLVQVSLCVFLILVYAFHTQKVVWLLLLFVMLSELYHPIRAVLGYGYSGTVTSLLFLPLIWFAYQVSALKSSNRI